MTTSRISNSEKNSAQWRMFWLNTMIFKHHNQKQFICYHFSWIHFASPLNRLHIFLFISRIHTRLFIWFFSVALTDEVVFRSVTMLSCHISHFTFQRPLKLMSDALFAMTFMTFWSDGNFCVLSMMRSYEQWHGMGKRKASRFIQCHVLATEKVSSTFAPER